MYQNKKNQIHFISLIGVQSHFNGHYGSLDFFVRYLDLAEVHRFADKLIILGQLLARGKLDKDLAQLPATANIKHHQI